MKVLVIGSGGREHALVWKLAQSDKVEKVYTFPGNAGTSQVLKNENISNFKSHQDLADWASNENIDLTVVGPEAPLSEGVVDIFQTKGLQIFGPTKEASRLESSKSFAKEIMLASGVETAAGEIFTDFEKAKEKLELHFKNLNEPIVIKADGLAAGKGVVVTSDKKTALDALSEIMLEKRFGDSGSQVLIEKFLPGLESSVMAIISEDTIIPLVISRDFKRLQDGDEGPNTGGMGAISPSNVLADSEAGKAVEEIFRPVVSELKKRGISYTGFLYAGLMISPEGKFDVLEFNCRLGDPETQVIMARLESDLSEVLLEACSGELKEKELAWSSDAAACVVLSSKGYPLKVEDNKEIKGLFPERDSQTIFYAGAVEKKEEPGKVFTKGGRILAVTGKGKSLNSALDFAYKGINEISFEGVHFRKDIGKKD